MNINADDLPETIKTLADEIGLPATIKLVQRFGGIMSLWVPVRFENANELLRVIGEDAARVLCAIYGGTYLSVPNCKLAIAKARNHQIQRDYANGIKPRELAIRHGITERWVWAIIEHQAHEDGDESKQVALF